MAWWPTTGHSMVGRSMVLVLGSCLAGACGPTYTQVEGPVDGTSSTGVGLGSSGRTTSVSADGPVVDGSTTAVLPSGTSTGGSATDSGSSGSEASTGDECGPPPSCGGVLVECGNGLDDDGDGQADFADPDCISACDDSEYELGSDLPPDNEPCDRDCFFDGTLGNADDMCVHLTQCDPLEPYDFCGYVGPPLCAMEPTVTAPPECVAFCEPLTPNGCDCFGCCTVQTPRGPRDVYLESFAGCTVDDGFAGCNECTQHMAACGNPCEEDACEICIGQTEPPAGCDEVGCVGGIPCQSTCDCPDDRVCITGCCLPVGAS